MRLYPALDHMMAETLLKIPEDKLREYFTDPPVSHEPLATAPKSKYEVITAIEIEEKSCVDDKECEDSSADSSG